MDNEFFKTNFKYNEADEDKVVLEDCKQMLEKLKAWKRLKDKGFRFEGWDCAFGQLYFKVPDTFFPRGGMIDTEIQKDLDLLFGGEE